MESQLEVLEVLEVLEAWETPEFEEIAIAAEVTMYVARLED
ncbi:pyrroloquinoline quinone precursor peptide PqqA [Streptomyces sp. NPDC000994]